jgi:hypothetical protein
LLEGVFRIFGAAGVEVFFVEEIVEAGGEVEVLVEDVSEGGGIEHTEAADGISGQRLNGAGVLSVEAGEEAVANYGDGEIEFAEMTRGVGEQLVGKRRVRNGVTVSGAAL